MKHVIKVLIVSMLVGLFMVISACGTAAVKNNATPDTTSANKVTSNATPSSKAPDTLKGDIAAKVTFVSGTPGWPQSMGFIADKQSYWKDKGLSGLKFTPLPSGTAAGEALGSGAAEIGYTNTATAIALIANGAPIKILTGTSEGGNGVVVWDKSINSVEKLKGKKIGVPQGRTTHELMFRLQVLKDAGLSYKDITPIPLNPQDTFLPLQRGEIDAAVMFDPYLGTVLKQGATLLVPPKDMWKGASYSSVLVASDKLIKENPALVQAVVDVHAKTVDFINKNQEQASQILAGISRQDPSETLSSLKNITVLAAADAAALQEFVDAMKADGQIKTAPDMKAAVDASFITRSVPKK